MAARKHDFSSFFLARGAAYRLRHLAGGGDEGWEVDGKGSNKWGRCPVAQVTRWGMRVSTSRSISCVGHVVGRGILIIVFISTIRAATLIRRNRKVSNCATRNTERFGVDAR